MPLTAVADVNARVSLDCQTQDIVAKTIAVTKTISYYNEINQ